MGYRGSHFWREKVNGQSEACQISLDEWHGDSFMVEIIGAEVLRIRNPFAITTGADLPKCFREMIDCGSCDPVFLL